MLAAEEQWPRAVGRPQTVIRALVLSLVPTRQGRRQNTYHVLVNEVLQCLCQVGTHS
jgi:hypothetical protein